MITARHESDYTALRSALAQFPDGASLEQVRSAAALPISERTLIRRLAQMVEDGLVRKEGESRAARYRLIPALELAEDGPPALTQRDASVPITQAGGEILRLVTRPVAARRPVGYNRRFLSTYRPNRTNYLGAVDKARLQAISKTVDAADPRAGTYAQRILNRLLIDLSWNSSRLEGNTYSLLDTQRLIEAGEAAEGKAAIDTQMILNHKAAIEFLVQSAEDIAFNRYTILNLHALLAENLLPDPAAAGRARHIPVSIGSSVFHPLDIPPLLNECFNELLDKAQALEDPFEQAFFVMVQLPYLQPFEDVNKRVSRLAANIPLIRRNLAPISFVDVPDDTYTWGVLGVYELNRIDLLRDVFLWAYERSAARYAAIRQTTGEPDLFRLRHRHALKQVVAEVIRKPMDQKAAAAHIAAWAAGHLSGTERARFVEIAETELMSIHEGNFARYQVRPREFEAWQAVWLRSTSRGR
ncbi:MAG TPA: Fic family protein [Hyphomicrobiaceae bacterium]|jgi:fido (protein-threonine AMPylation protein)